jgi:hypothetical protein
MDFVIFLSLLERSRESIKLFVRYHKLFEYVKLETGNDALTFDEIVETLISYIMNAYAYTTDVQKIYYCKYYLTISFNRFINFCHDYYSTETSDDDIDMF